MHFARGIGIIGFIKRNRVVLAVIITLLCHRAVLHVQDELCDAETEGPDFSTSEKSRNVVNTSVRITPEFLIYDSDFKRGLGNCMFKMASILGIAHGSRKIPVLSNTSKLIRYFDINIDSIASQPEVLNTTVKMFGGGAAKYKPAVLEARTKPHNITLIGYFQSWKYFRNITDRIRHLFTFRREIRQPAQDIVHSFRTLHQPTGTDDLHKSVVLVGVHVRRGDIVTFKRLQERGFTTPSSTYYDKAMRFMEEVLTNKTLVYVIASNDYAWARSHLMTSRRRVEFLDETNNEALDMCVLSLCDHVIMSVGTFSWWSAWLAGGVTVYYDLWPLPDTWFHSHVSHADYFLPSWIPLH